MYNIPQESLGGQAHDLEAQKQIPIGAQEHISKDPRLQELAKDPQQLQVILDVFERHKDILTKADNMSEQSRLWNESLKDYGQITQSGKKFVDLTESEVDGLSDVEYDRYNKWKIEGKKTTVNQKLKEERKIDEANNQNSEIIKNKKEIDNAVADLSKKLTPKDQSLVSTELQKAKSGSDNAAVAELRRQGASQTDIESGKYDSYISASIIVENATKFEAYQRDPGGFQKSLDGLKSLGIPTRIQPDFQSVRSHLESRFQEGSRLDTVSATMRQGLESGQYSSIHYDGIGDRYTLISADGKTEKSISMDKPPRAEIRLGKLSIDRELPRVTADDQRRDNLVSQLSLNHKKYSEVKLAPITPQSESERSSQEKLYKATLDKNLPVEQRLSALADLKSKNTTAKTANFKNMFESGTDPEPRNSQIENEARSLEALENIYREESALTKSIQQLSPKVEDRFDQTAQSALEALSSSGYQYLGQDNLDALMKALRSRDGQSGIWQDAGINMSDPEVRARQLSELRSIADMLTEKSGKNRNETFQDISKGIQINEAFRNTWKNPNTLDGWIKSRSQGKESTKIDSPSPTT